MQINIIYLQVGHIKAVIPVIQDLEDKICEEDEEAPGLC